MGIEFEVNSLEDMCELMCNNRLPKRRKKMSVSKWAWREACDKDYCPGDCDHCPRADYDEEEKEGEEDETTD